jgi:hypothetical protein
MGIGRFLSAPQIDPCDSAKRGNRSTPRERTRASLSTQHHDALGTLIRTSVPIGPHSVRDTILAARAL